MMMIMSHLAEVRVDGQVVSDGVFPAFVIRFVVRETVSEMKKKIVIK